MTVDYQKVWRTMNDLEMVTSKICSAREIIDCASEALSTNDRNRAETLMNAAYEFLSYYLEEFDKKFKDAWGATVGDLRTGDINRENPFKDKVKRWVLPVEMDGPSGECFISLPDDLLEAAGLEEGDQMEWVDNGNGTFLFRKVNA
jgi:hypothetical protein